MDWIERLLGLDLDGGDGSAEMMVVLACCVILTAVVAWRVPVFRENIKAMFGNKARQSLAFSRSSAGYRERAHRCDTFRLLITYDTGMTQAPRLRVAQNSRRSCL